MTEQEWLALREPRRMLEFLRDHEQGAWWGTLRRKARLFGCACVRRLWPLLNDPGRRMVEVAERFADGTCDQAELKALQKAPPKKGWAAGDRAATAAHHTLRREIWFACCAAAEWAVNAVARGEEEKEKEAQRAILADLCGHLFRTAAIRPGWLAWNDGTVGKIAQAIYDERAFERLPILADALEEADCDNADLLGHLRSPGPHVRGCWAVDLILGKQ